MQLVVGAAVQHAAQGRDVRVVAAGGERHVIFARRAVVGRVQVGPFARFTVAGQVDGHPGVRGVAAHQARLARRGRREQVAADVAGGQAQAAQAGDHHVRKVLAHAVAQLQRLQHRRAHVGDVGVVLEVGMDPLHQLVRGLQQRPARHEAGPRVGNEILVPRHVLRGEDELRGRVVRRAAVVAQALAHFFPGQPALRGHRRGSGHCAFRDNLELVVPRSKAEEGARVAVNIQRFALPRRGGQDGELVRKQPLPARVRGLEVRHVLRRLHGRRIVVACFVDDVQQHVEARLAQAPTL